MCIRDRFFSLFLLVIYVILISTRKEKQRQKELYEFSLAQKAVEAKNDFLAKMSHDIRTPLNGIIGMNYLTVPKIGTDDKGALQNLKKMEITSKYLLKLINDILDMSKIESGKMEIANKAFSLEAVSYTHLNGIHFENVPFLLLSLQECVLYFASRFPESHLKPQQPSL